MTVEMAIEGPVTLICSGRWHVFFNLDRVPEGYAWGANIGEPLFFCMLLIAWIPAFSHFINSKRCPRYSRIFIAALPYVAVVQFVAMCFFPPMFCGDVRAVFGLILFSLILSILHKYLFVSVPPHNPTAAHAS